MDGVSSPFWRLLPLTVTKKTFLLKVYFKNVVKQKRCASAILVGPKKCYQKKSKLKVWHSYRRNSLNQTSGTKKAFFQFRISKRFSTYCKLRPNFTKFLYTLLYREGRLVMKWVSLIRPLRQARGREQGA